ncbi:ras guanine nucleotide exchange factor domain-containing protein [Absidia repens]|uniref:Ras guanine nucleotide exchange factor domain-containing protein n=1 Tax=Absidia repens TaxID=90262 RepID=A0A1X2I1V6_9FUNG|nr:ras guanine nucleotide exchange factor domain-containing protein [Absidia repens]
MPTVPIICRVRALYSFKSNDRSSLQFEQGDCIEVLNKLKSGWWDGWCNGFRGWFPSNYVQVIEEYTNAIVVELPDITTKEQIQTTLLQQNSVGALSRPYTPNPSPPIPRIPQDSVPLQRNQEYRLSLPYNHTIDINIQQQQQQQQEQNHRKQRQQQKKQQQTRVALPANWIMEMTEDGTDCYYYNKLTGEMQISPPAQPSSLSSSSNLESGLNDNSNESTDDMDDDFSNQDKYEEEDFDFQSVSSQVDERESTVYDEEHSSMLPQNWSRRTNHQGRVYYCNLQTQDTTWDIKNIDPVTGNLLSSSNNGDQLLPAPIDHNNADKIHPSNTSTNAYGGKLDVNEPLTWSVLSTRIAVAISELNQAGKNEEKALFTKRASAVIDSIRLMLLASGTIDKDIDFIRTNAALRSHHRAMMAAMSKVMLTSFLTADNYNDNGNKLLSENNELLVSVRNFVGTCQDLAVPVQHIDPKLVLDDEEDESKQMPNQQKSDQAKYVLQHDLADNLDIYGTNMHESVDAILLSIKEGQLEKELLVTDSSRFRFGTNMFTQFRNLSSQTGQFLGLVDDIDFGAVKNSALMSDLLLNKQSLSDGLGRLFYQLQQLTNEHVPLGDILLDVQRAAESIHIPIRNICECINIMVYDCETSARPSLDTIQDATSLSPGNKTYINDNLQKCGESTVDICDGNQGAANDDEDSTTYNMEGSIFSGENTTYQGTELTEPSTVATSNSHEHHQSTLLKQAITTSPPKQSLGDSLANAKPSTTTAVVEKILQDPDLSSDKDRTTNTTATTPAPTPTPSAVPTPTQESEGAKSSHKLKKFFGDDVLSSDIATTKPSPSERPLYLQYDYDLTDISFNMEGNVKGGTLAALVERLTMHDYLDMNFNNTFLLTYRSFCTSTELLDLLEARYNLIPPSDIPDEDMEIWRQKKLKLVRLRVFNILKNWLEVYYNEEDHVILDRLMKFTDTTIRNTLSFSTDQLERLILKRKEGTEMDVGGLKKLVWTPQSIPQSILPRNPKKFKLLDLDPTELARQLTLMDFKMYSSIRTIECLDKSWSRETPDDTVPTAVNIRSSIEYCNQITSWVSDAILSQNDIKKRSNLIKFWAQVAEKCLDLNNFNTCMAILSAFDNSSVGRLKRTWEMVGARTNQILSHIRKIMGANRNFSEYRQLIHSVNPPCIPFLGIYLQDLTFIEDGNSNIIKNSKDLINFAKREKTAEVIREIQQYQTLFYKLKTVDEIQSFIKSNLQSTRDEDQLYKESLKLEPREREDEKITRLLQESGFL